MPLISQQGEHLTIQVTSKSLYLNDGRRSNKWAAPFLITATRASLLLVICKRHQCDFIFSWPPVESLPATANIKECFCRFIFSLVCRFGEKKNKTFVYLEVFPSHTLLRSKISGLASAVQCDSCLIYIYYLTVRYTVSPAPAHHAPAEGSSPGEWALNSVVFPATSDTYQRSEV